MARARMNFFPTTPAKKGIPALLVVGLVAGWQRRTRELLVRFRHLREGGRRNRRLAAVSRWRGCHRHTGRCRRRRPHEREKRCPTAFRQSNDENSKTIEPCKIMDLRVVGRHPVCLVALAEPKCQRKSIFPSIIHQSFSWVTPPLFRRNRCTLWCSREGGRAKGAVRHGQGWRAGG